MIPKRCRTLGKLDYFSASLVCLAACLLISCGGGGSTTSSGSNAPTINTPIAVGPSGVSLPAGGTQQFTANSTLVTWQVNGITGGNSSVGTISSTGLYTAPGVAFISAPFNVTISATPRTGTVAAGTTTLALTPPVISVSPTAATLFTSQTQLFKATVTNSPENSVVWTINGAQGGNASVGTIDSAGLYTPPAQLSGPGTFQITAALAANVRISAGATVTVSPAPSVLVSPATVTLAAGSQQKFTATVVGASNAAVTWLVGNSPGGDANVGTITSDGVFTAPLNGTTPALIAARAQADGQTLGTATATVLPPHAIGVRSTSTLAEFYNRSTTEVFLPRGNAYVRLGYLTDSFGRTNIDHTTFIVGLYDATRADAALTAMQANGYNITRVFMNGCCIDGLGDPAGGLNAAYVANVVDFLKLAKVHGIKVIFTQDWLPGYGGYSDPLGPCWPQFEMNNLNFLSSCGVAANVRFFQDFVQELITQKAPLDSVFAYELRSEYTYDAAYAPLSSNSGTLTTANGSTYDLSNAASRQAMMDDGLIYFVNKVAAAIRALDPTALVSIGFFAPQGPNPYRIGDERVIQSWPAVASSTADFVGVHPYPIRGGLTLDQYVQNFGFVGHQQNQPVIMEEFGAFATDYTEAEAAPLVQSWQIQSCAYGITGWLFWTWDTATSDQPWPPTLPASGGTGVINTALAPVNRPDPCKN